MIRFLAVTLSSAFAAAVFWVVAMVLLHLHGDMLVVAAVYYVCFGLDLHTSEVVFK
jgi:membrane-bound metal-dependent hydrolase YbcI (DUF457 family)